MEINEENRNSAEEKISTLLDDLASLESYIRDLFSFLPSPVCLVSSAKIILEANPAFEKITGYKTEEIIGKTIDVFFDKEKTEEFFERTLKEGFIKTEETFLFDKDKNSIPVSISTILRKNEEEEVVGFFFVIFDLSEIKKTEKILKDTQLALTNMLEDVEEAKDREEQEKNKTLSIITNLADGLLFFNNEEKIDLMNSQAENFFGLGAKEIIGKSLQELDNFTDLKPLVKLLGKKIEKIFRKEILIKKNLTLEVSTVPILREKTKTGTLVILHDISREKMIERMKSEFVSLAAHQLRTPLSAIKWTMKMLIEGDLGKITKEQKEFIEKTYHSNERMIELINDLLDVTRIEEGRYLYKPMLIDFGPVAQFVVNLYKEEVEKRQLKLEFKKPEKKLPGVMLDVEKIKLAIQNLIENAIKYTPSGGTVTVALKHDKNEIELSVQDSGVGIPEDQKERVFTKFFRGANVIRMETEGTGLGLFITKNIIEAHGGRIWFESEKDKGSTFYFSLPVKKELESFLGEF